MHKIVQTKFGLIRGLVRTNVLGGNYFSFKGIPYAEPPVGKLRFQVCLIIIINYHFPFYKRLVIITRHL